MTPADLRAMIGASIGTTKQGDTLVFRSKADLEIVLALVNHSPQILALWEAAQAVVERWDTPLWKDVPATAEYINALRTALAAMGK